MALLVLSGPARLCGYPRVTGTRRPLLASVSLLPEESLDCQVSQNEGKKQKQNDSVNAVSTVLNPAENALEPDSFQILYLEFRVLFKRAEQRNLAGVELVSSCSVWSMTSDSQ